LTGRLVVEQPADVERLLHAPEGVRRWAAAGRDRGRVASVLAELSVSSVEVLALAVKETPMRSVLRDFC